MNINDLLEEKRKNSDYPKFIKMLYSGNYVFAEISANRQDKSASENKENYHMLKDETYANSFGYFESYGSYIEDSNSKGFEKSFIVYTEKENREDLFNFSIACCELFEQDSILFIESNRVACYYDKDGDPVKIGATKNSDIYHFLVNGAEDFYTKIDTKNAGRNFSIDFREHPSNASGFRESYFKHNSPYVLDVKKLTNLDYKKQIIERIKTILK